MVNERMTVAFLEEEEVELRLPGQNRQRSRRSLVLDIELRLSRNCWSFGYQERRIFFGCLGGTVRSQNRASPGADFARSEALEWGYKMSMREVE